MVFYEFLNFVTLEEKITKNEKITKIFNYLKNKISQNFKNNKKLGKNENMVLQLLLKLFNISKSCF